LKSLIVGRIKSTEKTVMYHGHLEGVVAAVVIFGDIRARELAGLAD